MTNREIFRLISKDEKFKRVDFLRINHPDFKKGLELIAKCHRAKFKSADPQCMLITGIVGQVSAYLSFCLCSI
ncbi:hypothetical protein [Neobacillus soli]|uniref:hypothetical protein n=1 Tax=Neobacillus soli TaxID=220688 RepID=UPI0008256745|nr:hypothetical protein [Neobacillus soli]